MQVTRRNLLAGMAKGAAIIVAAEAIMPVQATAEESSKPSGNAVAMLYDATHCVGCQACVSACAQANHLSQNGRLDTLRQGSRDLSDTSLNIIKLCNAGDGTASSFVKQQCMHCVDPACVASCMFKALSKDANSGVVSWNPSRCVGCRYCEIVCPYRIPRFQWSGMNPRIVKCEFCKDRLAQGQSPACTSVCPTHAVIFGKRADLLREASVRTKGNPHRYFEDRAFGEHEGGGTQVLYLSRISFQKLGLPKLSNESIPAHSLKWQKRIYTWMLAPTAAYAVLVGLLSKRWRHHEDHMQENEIDTGLRPQL
jgi:Fe-S-cluster-containing dehydrogenase component